MCVVGAAESGSTAGLPVTGSDAAADSLACEGIGMQPAQSTCITNYSLAMLLTMFSFDNLE